MTNIVLVGEVFIGHERCADTAASTVMEQMHSQAGKFERFFTPVGLAIDEWKSKDVHESVDGYFVEVEARGQVSSGTDELADYINTHHSELYFNVNGFVPEISYA